MALPLFFVEQIDPANAQLSLDEQTSKHILQVLRMKIGETLHLTDGKGNLFVASIEQQQKKQCVVRLVQHMVVAAPVYGSSIAISLIKNTGRFEWFLEKATELGITEITPLICERTERMHFRVDRMKSIIVSAMLQSQQTWLPVLQEPTRFETWVTNQQMPLKCIAHCIENEKKAFTQVTTPGGDIAICIGPEGDFTANEINFALQYHFMPVSLGETRLRTETAGMVAATLLKIK